MSYKSLAQALLHNRPYFGDALRARQGNPARHRYFLPVIRRLAQRRRGPLQVLEVGSWAGGSAVSWALAIRAAGCQGTVVCVDSWRPYFDPARDGERHYQEMNEAARSGDVFQLFLHNIRTCGVGSMIRYVIGDSAAVLPKMAADSFDVIFVDGAHDFEHVAADLEQARRLAAPDGIICGDDLELDKAAVDLEEHQTLLASGKDFAWSQSAQTWYHPGVTEAVARCFGAVPAWEGFWAADLSLPCLTDLKISAEQRGPLPHHLAESYDETGQPQRLADTPSHTIFKIKGGYLALSKALGAVDFAERLGEREIAPAILRDGDLTSLQSRIKQLQQEASPPVKLLAETRQYNILRVRDQYVAVDKSLGSIDFSQRLGQRDLPPAILLGDSCEAVLERARQAEATRTPPIELLEETADYHVVKMDGRYLAVAKSLGEKAQGPEEHGQPPLLLMANSRRELRAKIRRVGAISQSVA